MSAAPSLAACCSDVFVVQGLQSSGCVCVCVCVCDLALYTFDKAFQAGGRSVATTYLRWTTHIQKYVNHIHFCSDLDTNERQFVTTVLFAASLSALFMRAVIQICTAPTLANFEHYANVLRRFKVM